MPAILVAQASRLLPIAAPLYNVEDAIYLLLDAQPNPS